MSKIIYCPSGKAEEYSKYAANFYVGCSGKCDYCYNRRGLTAKILGGDTPTLKKSLVDEKTAIEIFRMELLKCLAELQESGLFFSFVSDPCLPFTFRLNATAIKICLLNSIPAMVLTKQTWWVESVLAEKRNKASIWNSDLVSFGFTLTGRDDKEPGAARNKDRIKAMKQLKKAGFKTWASIEPVITVKKSVEMVQEIGGFVDVVKVGLLSGKKFHRFQVLSLMDSISTLSNAYGFKVFYKDSVLKQAGFERYPLTENSIDKDYNMFRS